jgi:hypothetical protein
MGGKRLFQFRAGIAPSVCPALGGLPLRAMLARVTKREGRSSVLTIGSYTEVGKEIHRRKNRFEQTYRANLTSTAVAAGVSLVGRGTFTIRKPANVKFHPSLLPWRFGYDQLLGNDWPLCSELGLMAPAAEQQVKAA